MNWRNLIFSAVFVFGASGAAAGKTDSQTTLMNGDHMKALVAESSGELALNHFRRLLAFAGNVPSLSADRIAQYIVDQTKKFGLTDVRVEKFFSDGDKYYGTFNTFPWWEPQKAELWLVAPEKERIANFDAHRAYLGRFSRSVDVTAELVDVGLGTDPSHYKGKSVAGKIVLGSGDMRTVHRWAVWEHGAAGVVIYRRREHIDRPDLIGIQRIDFKGPNGEQPTFGFSLSYRVGKALSDRLRAGEKIVVRAEIVSETRSGDVPQVHAVIKGTEPGLPEIWIQAHSNYRNTGGVNNLSAVGATLDLARSLASLIADGTLPRPRRNIRFVWGPEHAGLVFYFNQHPDEISSVLALMSLDIVGLDQKKGSLLHLYRTPYSLPSFINDIFQEVFESVAVGNSIFSRDIPFLRFVRGEPSPSRTSFRLPIVELSGSVDEFYYRIEEFWGPGDHEDMVEASIAIPAVILNAWPVANFGSQREDMSLVDTTQMKRAIVIAGASAYIMAAAGPEDIPALVQNALAKTRIRLAREERRAMDMVSSASKDSAAEDYRQAMNIITQTYRREAVALGKLEVYTKQGPSREYLQRSVEALVKDGPPALDRLERHLEAVVNTRGWGRVQASPPVREGRALLVPVRSLEMRGPVNFFRPYYGRFWLTEKLGDPRFAEKIRLARRGHFYLYETLNFADGKRNLGQIQDLVAAEWGPAPLEEIEEYFRLLEKVGIVKLR